MCAAGQTHLGTRSTVTLSQERFAQTAPRSKDNVSLNAESGLITNLRPMTGHGADDDPLGQSLSGYGQLRLAATNHQTALENQAPQHSLAWQALPAGAYRTRIHIQHWLLVTVAVNDEARDVPTALTGGVCLHPVGMPIRIVSARVVVVTDRNTPWQRHIQADSAAGMAGPPRGNRLAG